MQAFNRTIFGNIAVSSDMRIQPAIFPILDWNHKPRHLQLKHLQMFWISIIATRKTVSKLPFPLSMLENGKMH